MVTSGSFLVTFGSLPVTSGSLPVTDHFYTYDVPMKNASFCVFYYPKVEWPPPASEAVEANAIWPITTPNAGRLYMPSFNFLGLMVWISIDDKQDHRHLAGSRLYIVD